MKTFLKGTSAFAVVALCAGAGGAQAQTNWTLTLGGYYYGLAVIRNQDNPPGSDPRDYDFNQYGKYILTGSNELDNGLIFGFDTRYEMTNGFNSYSQKLFTEGGFGHGELGTDFSAAYNSHLWPPAAGWGFDDPDQYDVYLPTNGLYSPGATQVPTTTPYLTNRYMKVTYYTPRIAGFQGGVSFTPDTRTPTGSSGPFVGQNNRFITDENDLDQFKNAVSGAVNYEGEFGDLTVSLAGGVEWAKSTGTLKSSLVDARSHRTVYTASSNFGYGDWAFGVAYGYDDFGTDDYRQHNFASGLTYTFDSFTVGPGFGFIIEKGNGYNPDGSTYNKRKTWLGELGARYTLTEGVDLIGSVWYAKFDKGSGTDGSAKNGDALAGIFGVMLNF